MYAHYLVVGVGVGAAVGAVNRDYFALQAVIGLSPRKSQVLRAVGSVSLCPYRLAWHHCG